MQIVKELTTVVDILLAVSCLVIFRCSKENGEKAFKWFMVILLAVNIFLMWI